MVFASIFQCGYRFNSHIGLLRRVFFRNAPASRRFGLIIGLAVPSANLSSVDARPPRRYGRLARDRAQPADLGDARRLLLNLAGFVPPAGSRSSFCRLADASIALGPFAVGAALRLQGSRGCWAPHSASRQSSSRHRRCWRSCWGMAGSVQPIWASRSCSRRCRQRRRPTSWPCAWAGTAQRGVDHLGDHAGFFDADHAAGATWVARELITAFSPSLRQPWSLPVPDATAGFGLGLLCHLCLHLLHHVPGPHGCLREGARAIRCGADFSPASLAAALRSAAICPIARTVVSVERCISRLWMVICSIDRFMRSQPSTAFRSWMRFQVRRHRKSASPCRATKIPCCPTCPS